MIKVLYPERINLKTWADALVADYFNENLAALDNENDWQKWARSVSETGAFLDASVPSPMDTEGKVRYKKWEDWAKAVYLIMSNEYS